MTSCVTSTNGRSIMGNNDIVTPPNEDGVMNLSLDPANHTNSDSKSTVPSHATNAPIPSIATSSTFLMPDDSANNPLETYSVSIINSPVRDVVFALARDASIDVDIDSSIDNLITINAVNQTLPAILDRIVELTDLKYTIKDNAITISRDNPTVRSYSMDYVSSKRKFKSELSVSTNEQGNKNNSNFTLSYDTETDFWEDIVRDIKKIVDMSEAASSYDKKSLTNTEKYFDDTGKPVGNEKVDADKVDADKNVSVVKETATGNDKVVWNRSSGIIHVLATDRVHKRIQKFIDNVIRTITRQVFIEATIVSVTLSDLYQAGVDWNMLVGSQGSQLKQSMIQTNIPSLTIKTNPSLKVPLYEAVISKKEIPFVTGALGIHDLTATVKLLSQFGNAKILSTPKLTLLNNQTAVLRVTTNEVYFEAKTTPGSETTIGNATHTTKDATDTIMKTVPVGFIMQVTPQIDSNNTVSMNVRPTIQRVDRWVKDPNPNLKQVDSNVPVIRVQEMDSVLRVLDGQVAVMGGLMEETIGNSTNGIPFFSNLPIIGSIFRYRENSTVKTEMIIFLRPIVLSEKDDLRNIGKQGIYRERPFDDTNLM